MVRTSIYGHIQKMYHLLNCNYKKKCVCEELSRVIEIKCMSLFSRPGCSQKGLPISYYNHENGSSLKGSPILTSYKKDLNWKLIEKCFT